jgi:hypothetical protein
VQNFPGEDFRIPATGERGGNREGNGEAYDYKFKIINNLASFITSAYVVLYNTAGNAPMSVILKHIN